MESHVVFNGCNFILLLRYQLLPQKYFWLLLFVKMKWLSEQGVICGKLQEMDPQVVATKSISVPTQQQLDAKLGNFIGRG